MEINKKISKNCCFHGRQSECNFCANKKKSLSVIFSIAPENLSFFFFHLFRLTKEFRLAKSVVFIILKLILKIRFMICYKRSQPNKMQK